MVIERTSGEKDGRDHRRADPAERQHAEHRLQREASEAGQRDEDGHGEHARETAAFRRLPFIVQRAVEECDQVAKECDRMWKPAPQEIRIADQSVEDQCCRQQPCVIGRNQLRAPARRASADRCASAAGSEGPPQTVSLSGSTMRRSDG